MRKIKYLRKRLEAHNASGGHQPSAARQQRPPSGTAGRNGKPAGQRAHGKGGKGAKKSEFWRDELAKAKARAREDKARRGRA